MTKLSLKEVAHMLENEDCSDLKGEDIQDGAFAKLWDEYMEVSVDKNLLRSEIYSYLDSYITAPTADAK